MARAMVWCQYTDGGTWNLRTSGTAPSSYRARRRELEAVARSRAERAARDAGKGNRTGG